MPILMLAMSFASPAIAAPPPGPYVDPPLIAGPKHYCFGSAMQLRLSEDAAIKPYLSAEPWQPFAFIWRQPEGWISVSVDHQRIDLPPRGERLGLVRKLSHGKLYAYRAEDDEAYRLLFLPGKREEPVVTLVFLGADDAGSVAVERGYRTTTQLDQSDVDWVLSMIEFNDRCMSDHGSEAL